MREPVSEFALYVEQVEGREFRVRFGGEEFVASTPEGPASPGRGPAANAARVLAASVGQCLAAGLLFGLQGVGATAPGLASEVRVRLASDGRDRPRVGAIDVTLRPRVAAGDAEAIARHLDGLDDFCALAQSVREGLDVRVRVEPEVAAPEAAVVPVAPPTSGRSPRAVC